MEAEAAIGFTKKPGSSGDCNLRNQQRRNVTRAASKCTQKVGVAFKMTITVIIEEMPHNWCAHTPDLDDSILATGKTREAVIENFRDAMLDLFDYKRDMGEPVPVVTALEIHETREVETLETRIAA